MCSERGESCCPAESSRWPGKSLSPETPACPQPVVVSGFNKDVIYGNPDAGTTTTVGVDGVFGFFQNGYTPGTGSLNAGTSLTGGIARRAEVP